MRPVRITGRGRIALGLVSVLVASGLFVGYRTFVGGTDCEVTSGDRTVKLSRDRAARAAIAVASDAGSPRSVAAAARLIAREVGIAGNDGRLIASALTGRLPAALTCRGGGAGDGESDRLDAAGLTSRAARVRQDMAQRFGDLALGGFEPGGVSSGHMPGSAHYEGRAIDVFFRPIGTPNKRRGWALAQYLVAQAERLEINTVIFDGRIWTARRSFQGWRDYQVSHANRTAAVIRVLEHRDHVHVDVAD